ncbi:MAG: phosphotransferase family protein [Thermoleophilaceae bacterium]|nr:phosphotransferase family protein [Thermoleophilaceae bacterium]
MGAHAIAPDDVVRTHAEGARNARPPLLVVEPLLAFLDRHGLGSGDRLDVEPVGEGHSNVTYLIRRDGRELVLRRPPRPPLPPSAHDVLREARVLRALERTPVPVPRVLCVCDDARVIGAPFYVMDRVEGEVITSALPAVLDTPSERRRIGEELVDTLVELHAVDWRAAGLEGLGRPAGYLERQVRRFSDLWQHNKTREVPAVERVGAWLRKNLPASPAPTIVHGDYRLGNTMFARSAPARLVAVFDWEMATIGDPLADVGYLCATWSQAGDPSGGLFDLSPATRAEGFPTREELVARYEERSGRSAHDLRWYTVLALWKAVVFMEGNYKRALAGMTDDPFLRNFGEGVLELALRAEQTALSG